MATSSEEETSFDVCESENEEEQEFYDGPTDLPEQVELMPTEDLEGIEIPNQDQESHVSSPTVATGSVDPARVGAVVEAADINILILRETLIKYLGSRKEKNKEKLKWLGTLIEFKDFTTLLLDEKRKWKTLAQAGYEVHSFEQDKRGFPLPGGRQVRPL